MPPKPPARLRDGRALTRLGLAAGLVVPAGLLGTPAAVAIPVVAPAPAVPGAVADADAQAVCGDPAAGDFPIETRIHGGPDTYAAGGGYGTWHLDLTNTTNRTCHAIHPVLVLTDEDRTLTPEQIQLEFVERAHPDEEHRVTWESTDRDEQIGVFDGGEEDDGFPGFTVPANKTLTVEVRMAFTSDTRPGKVTASAAIVQRRTAREPAPGEPGTAGTSGTEGPAGTPGTAPASGASGASDGDWVGESAAYSFVVVEGGTDGGTDGGAPQSDAEGKALSELARTGRTLPAWVAPTSGALVFGGVAALLLARRLRGSAR
ncbi:hypothetical protein OG909_10220 [Streptomyces sp. NBC_01754]|uniref:hypothetical protein n=1 Tax=Streptomyces sp. NBC_01754 TaxID=2975930 RepID=UPI002DDA5B6E|nr:hypothetical protein [Streptomyces sp. NBC_01754]WSC92638.1 hypothetical protein OG909_10220 [Streptomyces sp. NBC_01754]